MNEFRITWIYLGVGNAETFTAIDKNDAVKQLFQSYPEMKTAVSAGIQAQKDNGRILSITEYLGVKEA
jgi:hypothetical protein